MDFQDARVGGSGNELQIHEGREVARRNHVRSTKIMVFQYKNHARNGASGHAGGLILSRLGWRAAEVTRAQLLMTARFREDGSGPDSLHVSIGEIEQLGGVTRGQ